MPSGSVSAAIGAAARPIPVQPLMGRFDVKPVEGRDPRAEWARYQAAGINGAAQGMVQQGVAEAHAKLAPSPALAPPPAQQAAQRKRKRSTSTSVAPGSGSPMPLAPLAIPAPAAAQLGPAPTPTPNPFVQPSLPHFMGFNNQTYRCICGTSVEPDKGTSTQCESCLAWQHAECFGLSEEDLEGVSNYFCHLCRPREIRRNEAYIADLVAMENASAALYAAGVVDPLTPVVGAGPGATRGGKRSRGGAKARTRGREPSVAASSSAGPGATAPAETPATPAQRTSLSLAGEDTPSATVDAPAATARSRKKPAQSRPARAKAQQAAASRGAASPSSGLPGTNAASPEPSYREGTAAPAVSSVPQTPAAMPSVQSDPAQGPLSLRILEYTPTNRNIPRGPGVRKALSGFLAEWANGSDEDHRSAAAAPDSSDIHMRSASGEPADSAAGTQSRRTSADNGRRRRRLSPSWTSEPDFAVLGPPAPPVILQGASLAALASRVEVREEREEATALPASADPVLSGTETRFENGYTRPTTLGVHTVKSAPEGTFFGEFRGEIFTSDQYQGDRINQYWELGMTKPQVHRLGPPLDLIIDARRYGNDLRFIRSGCHPNVVLRPLLHYDDDDNANVTLAFGIFASTRITAGKELVIGWEWDDHHVLHNLRSFTESAEAYGGFPSRSHGIPSALQQKFTVVMSCIAGLFPSCACVARMDCALVQMQRLGAGLPLITGKDVKGRQKNKRSVAERKLDLGPLVGACRSWRATSKSRQNAQAFRSRMQVQALQAATPSEATPDRDMAFSPVLPPAVPQDDAAARSSERISSPSPEAMQMDAPREVDPPRQTPVPATSKSPEQIAEPQLAPAATVVAEPTASAPSNHAVSRREASPDKPETLVVEPTPPADLELDTGEISDSSTLTEPLTHASDSEEEVDAPEKLSDRQGRSPMLPVRAEGGVNGRRGDSYRKGRRVMSPTSPNLVSVFNSEDADSRFEDVVHGDPAPKRPPSGDVVSPPVPKKAKRNRIVSDATVKENVAINPPSPARAVEPEPDKPNRAAGMTPEMVVPPPAEEPSRANSPARHEGESRDAINEDPQLTRDQVPDRDPAADQAASPLQLAAPEAEPTVPEPAVAPKRRRIDLKRFAVSAAPPAPALPDGESSSMPADETSAKTPLDIPGDVNGQQNGTHVPNGHSPWTTSTPTREPVDSRQLPEVHTDTSTPWWAKSAPNRSFSLSGQLQADETNKASVGSTETPTANGLAKVVDTSTLNGYHAQEASFDSSRAGEALLQLDAENGSRASHPPVTPRVHLPGLPVGESPGTGPVDARGTAATAEWSSVPGFISRRDDPPHAETDQGFYRDRAPSNSRVPPVGPRSGWTERDDADGATRDRDFKDSRKEERPDWEHRDNKDVRDLRDVPRGPRSDYRGRPPPGPFVSPGRATSSFPPSTASNRGLYPPRGGYGDGYRGGRGRGGEPYRGRGGFGRGRGSGPAGPGGYYQNARGRI